MTAVRPAQLADAEAMAQVHVAAWRAGYAGLMTDEYLRGLDEGGFAAFWRSTLAEPRPDVCHLVAGSGGVLSGIGSAGTPRQPMPDGVGEVLQLNLHPRSWRRGLGTLLHDALLGELAGLGYRSAYLWVLEGNARAEAFYLARGWHPDGGRQLDDRAEPPVPEVRYVRDRH